MKESDTFSFNQTEHWKGGGKKKVPFWTLATAFQKTPKNEWDFVEGLSYCIGGDQTGHDFSTGAGGTWTAGVWTGCGWTGSGDSFESTGFFGDSAEPELGVAGGVMKTVYGPILPILGGGVDSVLMGILLPTPKKFQEMVDFW